MADTAKYKVVTPNHIPKGADGPCEVGTVLELTARQAAGLSGKVELVTAEAEDVKLTTPQAPTTKRRGRPRRKAKAAG